MHSVPKKALQAFLFFVMIGSTAPGSFGQTSESISVGPGTLSYKVTTSQLTCVPNPGQRGTIEKSAYTNFSFNDSSGTYSFGNADDGSIWSSPGGACPHTDWPPVTLIGPSYAITFTPSGTSGGAGVYNPAGLVYPAYKVLSILYAPPGNLSTTGYLSTTTNGTSTSITNSFAEGTSLTFTSAFDFLGFGASFSSSSGVTATTGNTGAFTQTLTDAEGVSLSSVGTNPNAINHNQDLFIIWLNPAVQIIPTGSNTAVYSVGTQTNTSGQLESVDFVKVTALTMMPSLNAQGQSVTTVPLAILLPQDDANLNPTLPGLEVACANPLPPADCTFANQCGCVPSDFAAILAKDPLLGFSNTESPLNADTSGQSCAAPTSSDLCRYIPISLAQSLILQGPSCVGCNTTPSPVTLTDSSQTSETFMESTAETESYMVVFKTPGINYASTTQFTWTDGESTGQMNGIANSMTATLNSNTVGCEEDIALFEDTVFHTFAFQQPANDTSCP